MLATIEILYLRDTSYALFAQGLKLNTIGNREDMPLKSVRIFNFPNQITDFYQISHERSTVIFWG